MEDYTDPQQQTFITTLRSIKNSTVLFCVLSEEDDAKTTLCYDPVFITRGFAAMMETTQHQMMMLQKKPFCETVHPDDQQYVEESVRSLNIEHPHTNILYRKRNPQGKWFYMQSDFSYFIVGKKKYIYVTYQDVSALQKNEELSNALHYSQRRDEELTKALEALGTVFTNIFLVHVEDQKVEWLKIQADKENVLKRCQNVCEIRKLIHDNYMLPEYRQGYLEFTDLDTISERFEKHKILRYIYRNRNRQWIEVSAIVQNRDKNGRVTDIQFLTHDVTDQRERELQQEDALRIALASAEHANKAKTAFLNNMSHDIRTPMNVILGYNQLMKSQLTEPKQLDYQKKIEQSGKLLLSIINNVLDMARIESGKMKVDENYERVGEVVDEIISTFASEAEEKGIHLSGSMQVTHRNILCDGTKIREIYVNLVSNAIKYTPRGGNVTITVEELPCEKERYIKIKTKVKDTGIGMSKEYLPTLFEPFSREHNTTTGKVGGTGLGMPIVKRMVDLMGGSIEVESELGKGTIFTVTLMHKMADEKYYSQEIETVIASDMGENLRGKHVLLAEDNDLNAEIAMAVLEETGLVIERVEDGIQCVNKVEQMSSGTYDLILMDIQMPNMDGYKATKCIRRLDDKKKAEIPIIAMTANAFAEDKKRAFDAGMNGHIAKPIDIEKLGAVILSVLIKQGN